jgi:membrane protein implicated in regulation of membrane protease activity
MGGKFAGDAVGAFFKRTWKFFVAGIGLLLLKRYFSNLPKPVQWVLYSLYTLLIPALVAMFIFTWFLRKDPFVIFKPSLHDPGFLFFLAIFALILPIVGFFLKRFLFGKPLRATKEALVKGKDITVEKMKAASGAGTGAIKTVTTKSWEITKSGPAKAGEVVKLIMRGAASGVGLLKRALGNLRSGEKGRFPGALRIKRKKEQNDQESVDHH